MKNKLWLVVVTATLICTLTTMVGCSQNNSTQILNDELAGLPSVAPEYTSEWPENEFTELIPQPEYGTLDYVCDYSESGRYMLVLTNMTKDQSNTYVDDLKKQGFSEIHSKGNQVSVGTMLQKDNVILSVAYSDNIFNILITIENDT